MTDSLLESIAEELRAFTQTSSIVVSEEPWGTAVRLPPADGADYRFVFSRQRTGEYCIQVELVDGTAGPVGSRLWYLHQSFALEEFDESTTRLATAFRSAVLELVQARSRIRQERGWLVWKLYLEREAAPDDWVPVYSCAFMRWRAGAPAESRTFHAPPVTPGRPYAQVPN